MTAPATEQARSRPGQDGEVSVRTETGGSVVILMYHRIGLGEVAGREAGESIYAVTADTLADQLSALASSGIPVLSFEQVAEAELQRTPVPARAVALTFDDGNATDYGEALPALSRHGFQAAFFISPELVGRPGYMTWQEVRELAAAGMTIGAHGLDHRLLSHLDDRELDRQLRESRRLIETALGEAPRYLSLPGGAGDDRVLRATSEAGYLLVAGSVPRRFAPAKAGRGALPRFAIRHGDSLARFRALVEQRPAAMLERSARHLVLGGLRRAVGEKGYARLRRGLSTTPAPPPSTPQGSPAPSRFAAIKRRTAEVLRGTGVTSAWLHFERQRPLILRYHRIYPDGGEPAFYDMGIRRSLFEAQLDYLAANFRVVGLDEIVSALAGERALPDHAVAITFDDGYRDNYTEALPALASRGLPATLFVSVENIDRRTPFWWDRLAAAVATAPDGRVIADPELGISPTRLDGIDSRRHLFDAIREALKLVPFTEFESALARLEDGLQPCDVARGEELLSWEEVAKMMAGGFEIGSHTLTHPILSRLSAEELGRQVVASRSLLEERTGRRVRYFSYPNGKMEDASAAVFDAVNRAGYEAAVSTIEGRVGRGSDRFFLERKGVTNGISADGRGCFDTALFATELAGVFDLALARRRRGRAIH